MDTAVLEGVISSDFAVPEGHSASDFTAALFHGLGSADSDLRENSLSVLCEWIERGKYTPNRMTEIGTQAATNLTCGIGEPEADSVFLRAFSVLVLASVIAVDEAYSAENDASKDSFLTGPQVHTWLEQGLSYFQNETDRRGYVAEKGWAHAAAHTADLLRVFARNRYVGRSDLKRILDAIAEKVSEPANRAFLHQEDDRLARTTVSVLLRDELDMPFLGAWLDRLACPSNERSWNTTTADAPQNNARVNTQSFLRSLYFQLLIGGNARGVAYYERSPRLGQKLLSEIVHTLRLMDQNRFYRAETDELTDID